MKKITLLLLVGFINGFTIAQKVDFSNTQPQKKKVVVSDSMKQKIALKEQEVLNLYGYKTQPKPVPVQSASKYVPPQQKENQVLLIMNSKSSDSLSIKIDNNYQKLSKNRNCYISGKTLTINKCNCNQIDIKYVGGTINTEMLNVDLPFQINLLNKKTVVITTTKIKTK